MPGVGRVGGDAVAAAEDYGDASKSTATSVASPNPVAMPDLLSQVTAALDAAVGVKPWLTAEGQFDMTSLRKLGEGSYGAVYAVRYKDPSKHPNMVAMKVVSKSAADLASLLQELMVLKRIQASCSQYLLCFQEAYDDPKTNSFRIITEFLGDYMPMDDALKQIPPAKMPFAQIIYNLLMGLKQIHALQVAHRDIKPGNIMINFRNGKIKYIDFGVSCASETCEKEAVRAGTPAYIAPEVFAKEFGPFTLEELQRSDFWSLGLTIWELLLQPEFMGRETAIEIWLKKICKVDPTTLQNCWKPTEFYAGYDFASAGDPLAKENALAESRMNRIVVQFPPKAQESGLASFFHALFGKPEGRKLTLSLKPLLQRKNARRQNPIDT